MSTRFLLFSVACVLAGAGHALAQYDFDQSPIGYSQTTPTDEVGRLKASVAKGRVSLVRDSERGYLTALLRKLDIPVSSQSLVFSKTSFQRDAIDPSTPRAIYFNDETYVGYIPGAAMLEVASTDPVLGSTFYTIDQQSPRAEIVRQTHDCLQCHAGSMTRDLPGLMMRSVFTDPRGQPILSAGTKLTTHESPMDERFGGWYVTGTHGGFDVQPHRGNVVGKDRDDPDPVDPRAGADVTDLAGRFDHSAYPSPHSDIVALMVLAHQVEGHNLITRAGYACRFALRDAETLNRALDQPADHLSDSTIRRIENPAEALVRYLLFVDEPALIAPISGTSGFAEDFSAQGPKDAGGRSLRDFDLSRRLFRYPLSYLIYSKGFDGLPAQTKAYVYKRLFDVLSGKVTDEPYNRISGEDRQSIFQILRDTKPDLPDYWRVGTKP